MLDLISEVAFGTTKANSGHKSEVLIKVAKV